MRYFINKEDAHRVKAITELIASFKSGEPARISMEMLTVGLNQVEINCGVSQAMLMLSGVLAELGRTVEKDEPRVSAVDFINAVADYAELELETRKNE